LETGKRVNGQFVIRYSSADVPVPDDCRVIPNPHEHLGCIECYEIEDGRDIIAEWQPVDPKDVAIELTIEIGRKVAGIEEIGTHLFLTAVYTHAALARMRRKRRSRIDTERCIVVHEFDWPKIKRSIENILKKCERDTFDESIHEFGKRFRWEYGR
jgi:hypothetical protein